MKWKIKIGESPIKKNISNTLKAAIGKSVRRVVEDIDSTIELWKNKELKEYFSKVKKSFRYIKLTLIKRNEQIKGGKWFGRGKEDIRSKSYGFIYNYLFIK